jgi:hypothetical protein
VLANLHPLGASAVHSKGHKIKSTNQSIGGVVRKEECADVCTIQAVVHISGGVMQLQGRGSFADKDQETDISMKDRVDFKHVTDMCNHKTMRGD